MIRDYCFKDIEKYLKKDTDIGREILDAFKGISDAVIIFGPIVFGEQFLPLLELLDVKDRLLNLGHQVYDFITQKVELDYIDRIEQIKAAYALICYTAYFDVLQDTLSCSVRKKLKLKLEKKKELIEKATGTVYISNNTPNIYCSVFCVDHTTSFSDIRREITEVYERVTRELIKVIIEMEIFDEEKEREKQEFKHLKETLGNLPQKALEIYEAQYLKLADQFNDFALFAQLKNFEGIYRAMEKNKDAIDLLVDVTKKIDVGFSKLNSIVNSIATNYGAIQAQDIVDDLKRNYILSVEKPIIDTKEIEADGETISLKFPRIIDAFIPQSYKCLSYQDKGIKLEDIL